MPDTVPPWGSGPDPDDLLADLQAGPDQPPRWTIPDDSGAEWAFQRLVEASEQLAAVNAQTAEWLRQLDTWADDQRRPHQQTADHMRALLERFALEQRAAGRKSVKLPSGTLATRTTPATVRVSDKDRLVEWVAANLSEQEAEQVLAWDVRPRVGELAKRFLVEVQRGADGEVEWLAVANHEAGELLPGVEAVPPSVSATVKPAVSPGLPR